jgi:PhzF family phenazine biosynthesis protein
VTTHTFKQIDVFSNKHFRGNPVAVVLDAEGISDDEMQAIAAWTNLSETTFFQPATTPDADYLLRIYTPRAEIPFAGHPTIGSAHAAIEAGAFT